MWAAEMFRAAKLGHEKKVSRILDADPTLLEKGNHDGNTPLVLAAQAGQLGVVKLLVHRGASINASGEGRLTAFHYAALDGHAGIVAFLLSKGVPANVRGCLDATPLMMAARKGHLGVVQMLLEHMGGRGLDDEDHMERTALIHAAEGGHEDMVAFILGTGAQAGITSTAAAVALVTAVCGGHLGMCTMLARHIEEQHGHEDPTYLYATALYKAAINGYEELVAFLLSRGARADIRDERSTTPLIKAAAYGYMGVVQMLLPHIGTRRLEEKDDRGETALYGAAENGHEALVTFLLGQGARADGRNAVGATPLMAAAGGAHLGVVKLLLQYRGERGLEERDHWGSGVLHSAVEDADRFTWRHRERGPVREHLVRFLLCAGADANATDNKGNTPHALAVANNHVDCVRVFEWWEGELERRFLLQRARCLHDAYTMHQAHPTAPVPAFLHDRAATMQALPEVEMAGGHQEDGQRAGACAIIQATRKAGSVQREEERHAVLAYVTTQLNEQLFIELMQCFPGPKAGRF